MAIFHAIFFLPRPRTDDGRERERVKLNVIRSGIYDQIKSINIRFLVTAKSHSLPSMDWENEKQNNNRKKAKKKHRPPNEYGSDGWRQLKIEYEIQRHATVHRLKHIRYPYGLGHRHRSTTTHFHALARNCILFFFWLSVFAMCCDYGGQRGRLDGSHRKKTRRTEVLEMVSRFSYCFSNVAHFLNRSVRRFNFHSIPLTQSAHTSTIRRFVRSREIALKITH